MEGKDILQPIRNNEIPELLRVLRDNLPDSIVAYDWIRMQNDWKSKLPNIKVYILCPHGDWRNGTVVAFTDKLASEGRQFGVLYAKQGDGDLELAGALMNTRAIPWHTMLQFTSVLERHVEPLLAAARAAGVKLPPLMGLAQLAYFPASEKFDVEQAWSILNSIVSEALPLDEPGLRLVRLTKHHVDQVWQLRNYFHVCYKPVIAAALDLNPSYGIFATQPDGSELLISLAIQGEHGGLAMGQTHPDFMRKGLNKILGANVICEMIKLGYMNPHGTTLVTNHKVLQYLKESEFVLVGNTRRVEISPPPDKSPVVRSVL